MSLHFRVFLFVWQIYVKKKKNLPQKSRGERHDPPTPPLFPRCRWPCFAQLIVFSLRIAPLIGKLFIRILLNSQTFNSFIQVFLQILVLPDLHIFPFCAKLTRLKSDFNFFPLIPGSSHVNICISRKTMFFSCLRWFCS